MLHHTHVEGIARIRLIWLPSATTNRTKKASERTNQPTQILHTIYIYEILMTRIFGHRWGLVATPDPMSSLLFSPNQLTEWMNEFSFRTSDDDSQFACILFILLRMYDWAHPLLFVHTHMRDERDGHHNECYVLLGGEKNKGLRLWILKPKKVERLILAPTTVSRWHPFGCHPLPAPRSPSVVRQRLSAGAKAFFCCLNLYSYSASSLQTKWERPAKYGCMIFFGCPVSDNTR